MLISPASLMLLDADIIFWFYMLIDARIRHRRQL